MSEDCHESGPFDWFYRDYVLRNVARSIRQEFMEEAVRQLEIAELERVWEESK